MRERERGNKEIRNYMEREMKKHKDKEMNKG